MTTAEDQGAQVRQIAEDFWQDILQHNPTLATFYGDERYNDRLDSIGPEARAEEQSQLTETLARLRRLQPNALTPDDRVTWDMLRLACEFGLQALQLRLDEMAVDQMGGPQVALAELLNWHPTDTPEHTQQLIARFHAFPEYMRQYLDNLQDGVRDGRTAPRIAVERVIAQLQALLSASPEDSPFTAAIRGGQVTGAQADDLLSAVHQDVYPAYQQMLGFLAGSGTDDGAAYLARARQDPGVWAVRDGEAIYTLMAQQHTTTTLTPSQLHQIGLDDLAGIHAEMRQIMSRLGDDSGNIRAFTERLTRDPANLARSREEIVERSEALLAQARTALPRAFGRLPTTDVIVKPIEDYREKDSVAAFYYPPSDTGRPGIFYINTFEPSSRPKHTLPALVFHESLPGHHLQIAIAQETGNLPAFRRLGAGVQATAFVEGWGLYSERLGDELGLYPDDLARFGMLGYQAWRACRLVVDTGLHFLRWSRQQAIEFFYENVGLTERETVNEVDRYIIWPGQALAYKIGQREIESLRREVQSRFGPDFDLRAFHDEVLRHAGLPLSTLRTIVLAAFPAPNA